MTALLNGRYRSVNRYRKVKALNLPESAEGLPRFTGYEHLQATPSPARRPPPDIIAYAVWLYYRFNLSHRDIEDLLAQRGITVTREAIRLWYPRHSLRSWGRLCIKFGALYARRLKQKHRGYGDTFYIDEVFAGVPDHSNQRQATLSVASCRPREPATRTALGVVKRSMCICRRGAMVLLQSGSSDVCSVHMAVSPGRS